MGIVTATLVWIACWLIAPASWWLNERILDEQAFRATMTEILQIENVDAEITDRATAQVMQDARTWVADTVPLFATQADFLLDRAEPTVAGLVNGAVNSQPGERAMLGMATQIHNVFVAWLEQDSLGQPGLQADLGQGEANFDLDELLAGETVSLGPVEVPLDALDLPGLSVPVPLPPDWMRTPLVLVRDALLPSVLVMAASAVALVALDRGRTRALAVASGVTAVILAGAALLLKSTWTVSGADSADWTITRAVGELLVAPWITAYVVVGAALAGLCVISLIVDRLVVSRRPA
ncbi:MAG: hypothetical protein V9E82_15255 [Candidatus Nanopelagicales bacterium]